MIQHKKKKSNRKPVFIIILLIVLIFISGKNPESVEIPSNIFNTIITPINRTLYSFSTAVDNWMESIFGPLDLQEEVVSLNQEILVQEEKLRELELIINSSDFLEAEYDLMNSDKGKYVQGNVTGMDSYALMKRFTINLGTKDSVKVNDVVVQGVKVDGEKSIEGLVGRVTEVGLNYAKVSTILDDLNDLSFRNSSNNEIGIINQREGEFLYGAMLNVDGEIEIGDSIITSGVGGIYPKGIYIGRVIDIEISKDGLTKNVVIESPVNFDKLYRVMVYRNDGVDNE